MKCGPRPSSRRCLRAEPLHRYACRSWRVIQSNGNTCGSEVCATKTGYVLLSSAARSLPGIDIWPKSNGRTPHRACWRNFRSRIYRAQIRGKRSNKTQPFKATVPMAFRGFCYPSDNQFGSDVVGAPRLEKCDELAQPSLMFAQFISKCAAKVDVFL